MGPSGQDGPQEAPARPRVDRGAQGRGVAAQPLLRDQNAEARCCTRSHTVEQPRRRERKKFKTTLLSSMSGVRLQNVGLYENIKYLKNRRLKFDTAAVN